LCGFVEIRVEIWDFLEVDIMSSGTANMASGSGTRRRLWRIL